MRSTLAEMLAPRSRGEASENRVRRPEPSDAELRKGRVVRDRSDRFREGRALRVDGAVRGEEVDFATVALADDAPELAVVFEAGEVV